MKHTVCPYGLHKHLDEAEPELYRLCLITHSRCNFSGVEEFFGTGQAEILKSLK